MKYCVSLARGLLLHNHGTPAVTVAIDHHNVHNQPDITYHQTPDARILRLLYKALHTMLLLSAGPTEKKSFPVKLISRYKIRNEE